MFIIYALLQGGAFASFIFRALLPAEYALIDMFARWWT